MSDIAAIPGMTALRSRTHGDPRIKIAVLDGWVDLKRACFKGANLARLNSFWIEPFDINPADIKTLIGIENNSQYQRLNSTEKEDLIEKAIPDGNVRGNLHLHFHATHIISTLCGQPGSPMEGIAPKATVINIPIAVKFKNFINPLNLSRAIEAAIEQGVDIIHCAACRPTQSDTASGFIDKAIKQAQENNILVIAPGGNDKGKCWCVPAVLDNVIAVGAMKDTGEPFKFSNFGGKYSSQGILAPGENILGAQPGTDIPIRKKGTSCAAPIVTGTAALLMALQLEKERAPDADAVRIALQSTAIPCDPKTVEEPERCLLGKLNIPGAYEAIVGQRLETVPTQEQGKAKEWEKGTVTLAPVPVLRSGGKAIAPPEPSPVAAVGLGAAQSALAKSAPALGPALKPVSVSATPIIPSDIQTSFRSNLTYALGTLGYDFGTEPRRDAFRQWMATSPNAKTEASVRPPVQPNDISQMAAYLNRHPIAAKSLIWTLNQDQTPIYAIQPVEAYAMAIYERLLRILENHVERVSVPGRVTNKKVRLLSGQEVPILRVNSPRGLYGWNVDGEDGLVASALNDVALKAETLKDERMHRSLTNFLNEIYYSRQNLGRLARDRALNFAATNPFQAIQCLSDAIARDMKLATINVVKSNFCRYGSECWDIKLEFFAPEDERRANRIFFFTLDVSDVVPVTLGTVRSWAVSIRCRK